MDVLVVGSGGREHALAWGLSRDPSVRYLYAAPGNAGVSVLADIRPVDETDPTAVAELAEKLAVDLVVIGPEAPLAAGAADAVRDKGIACFGPSAAAARIEGSKAYAKEVMAAAGVPTARAYVCENEAEAAKALDAFGPPYVVKDDGLAAGKGVVVTSDRAEALAHANSCGRVVVEEFLDGPEVSVFAITDGTTVLPMIPAQDFKRAGNNDEGPNTGGMGAYAPLDWLPAGFVDDTMARVVRPTIDELRRAGTPYVGVLYTGLALTSRGIRVVEFNARFGDPEAQVLFPLTETPLGGLLYAAATGQLADVEPIRWRQAAAVTVVLAAHGYPESPRKGDVIHGVNDADARDEVEVFHAGTAFDAAHALISVGGRVLTVTGTGESLAHARDRAYEALGDIRLDGARHRTDIAAKAINGGIELTQPYPLGG